MAPVAHGWAAFSEGGEILWGGVVSVIPDRVLVVQLHVPIVTLAVRQMPPRGQTEQVSVNAIKDLLDVAGIPAIHSLALCVGAVTERAGISKNESLVDKGQLN